MITEGRIVSVGVITPHAAEGPETEWPRMAPGRIGTRVCRIPATPATAIEPRTPPTSPSGLRSLATPTALQDAAASLAGGSIDAFAYASTSTGYAIGHDAEAALVDTLSRRQGVPVDATSTAAVTALRVMAIEHVALVHPPWFDRELNELGAAYFRAEGFDVTSSISADLPRDPDRITTPDVISWISRHLSGDAQAVFIGGNGFRVSSAIDLLEKQTGRLVLAANQVLLWSLLAKTHSGTEVAGYGALFQQRPPQTSVLR
jgi:maleate isomerase